MKEFYRKSKNNSLALSILKPDLARVNRNVNRKEDMRIVGIGLLALGLGFAGGGAQEVIRTQIPLLVLEPNPKAEQLRRQAEAIYDKPGHYRRAAALHVREGQVRKVSDPQRSRAFSQAGRLYSYIGESSLARHYRESAARSALQRGDVGQGAHALLDAAFLAIRDRDVMTAQTLARQAELLAQSPLLSEEQRFAIVRRIDPARLAMKTR
jgi:hypothetical protein